MGHEMKLALAFLCFTSFYVTVARASAFWEDFYVNFGDWMVEYPGDEIEAGNIVDLRLDNTTGTHLIFWAFSIIRFESTVAPCCCDCWSRN